MYTNEHQTYTDEERAIKTQFVADAITRALDAMDDGTIQSITYHIHSIRKGANGNTVFMSHRLEDVGWAVDSGLLMVRYGRSDIEVVSEHENHAIVLSWYTDSYASVPLTDVKLAVDPDAQSYAFVDVIDHIEVDTGADDVDLLDWYVDACLSDDAQDVTDDEAGDME